MADGRIKLEVAVSRVEDAQGAAGAGADRLELSSALELGGLTPSPGLVESARAGGLPLVLLLRPRAGGFVYSERELATMLADAAIAQARDEIAFGFLKNDRTIDAERCKRMLERIGPRRAVFHRAFDVVRDPMAALDQLIELGFKRVLTSGQAATALEGAALIRRLVERAAGRIEILPGGGIRAHNVAEVIEQTGCREVHGTFSKAQADPAGLVCDARFFVTDAQQVAKVRETMDKIP